MEKNEKDKNKRRLEHLKDIVENKTRTERHLEEYGHISKDKKLNEVNELQIDREDEIDNLENIIIYGKHRNSDDVENLQKNMEYTEGYIEHNVDHMNDDDIKNAKEKQAHRIDQLKTLKDKKRE